MQSRSTTLQLPQGQDVRGQGWGETIFWRTPESQTPSWRVLGFASLEIHLADVVMFWQPMRMAQRMQPPRSPVIQGRQPQNYDRASLIIHHNNIQTAHRTASFSFSVFVFFLGFFFSSTPACFACVCCMFEEQKGNRFKLGTAGAAAACGFAFNSCGNDVCIHWRAPVVPPTVSEVIYLFARRKVCKRIRTPAIYSPVNSSTWDLFDTPGWLLFKLVWYLLPMSMWVKGKKGKLEKINLNI